MGYYSDLFTQKCENTKATDAYVMIVEELLSEHPDLIGQYEPYFTEDMSRAEKYTGVTRYTKIEEKNIAIKT
ncbi:MAG: hypothetical protein IJ600_00845, partial [Lachnospiraceae bacterium]|nr:hypothetical protein [Lachnospiraceae bacterium]